jgi:hypothetical protein
MQEYVVGEGAMVTAWPDSLCGQLYPASGWEGRNYLIEKSSSCERVNCDNKIKSGVSPIKLAVGLEDVVG